jgi:hypothetical protein
MRAHTAWLWLGGTLTAFATAFIAYAAALAAARRSYPLWTSGQIIAAYSFAAGAAFCLVAAIRGVPFPFVTVSEGKSWEVESAAAGNQWGARAFFHQGRLQIMLECYQHGARVSALRCILRHPSGVEALATNALARTFDDDHFNHVFWEYPADFRVRGRGQTPDPIPGEYRLTWLAQVAELAGAVRLCDSTLEVPAAGEAPPGI